MRRLMLTATLGVLLIPEAVARPAFFWSVTNGSYASVDYISFGESDFNRDQGAVDGSRSLVRGQYDFSHARGWVLGFGHEYNAFDISAESPAPPQTNGDLHTLHLATQWRAELGNGHLRAAFAPALSVSSNGLKNPDELNSDAVQLWGALLYRWPANGMDWLAGMAHDYRHGNDRIYPVAGIEWSNDAVFLRATFPDLELRFDLGSRWIMAASVEPDGNEWWAYDRGLSDANEFRRQAWKADARLSYQFANGVLAGASVGYHWDQEWRFRRQDNSLARLHSDNSYFVGLHISWHARSEK